MAHDRTLGGSIKNIWDFLHVDWTHFAEEQESTFDQIRRGDPSTFTFGDGDNEINLIYHATLIGRAAPVLLDLTDGTLIDEFGGTLNFSHVKGLRVINLDDTNGLDVLGPEAAADSMLTILVPAGADVVDHLYIPPLGEVSLVNPLAGWATAAGADRIEIDPGGNTVVFDVIIVGIGTRNEDQPTTTSTAAPTTTTPAPTTTTP